MVRGKAPEKCEKKGDPTEDVCPHYPRGGVTTNVDSTPSAEKKSKSRHKEDGCRDSERERGDGAWHGKGTAGRLNLSKSGNTPTKIVLPGKKAGQNMTGGSQGICMTSGRGEGAGIDVAVVSRNRSVVACTPWKKSGGKPLGYPSANRWDYRAGSFRTKATPKHAWCLVKADFQGSSRQKHRETVGKAF